MVVLSEEHTVVADGTPDDVLAQRDLLLEVNLIHEHAHRHGAHGARARARARAGPHAPVDATARPGREPHAARRHTRRPNRTLVQSGHDLGEATGDPAPAARRHRVASASARRAGSSRRTRRFADGRDALPQLRRDRRDAAQLFPADRLRRLDARIRRYHADGEHEIVVILVATFLETLLEDMLDRIMAAEGAEREAARRRARRAALGRPAHRQALPHAHRRAVRGRRRRARLPRLPAPLARAARGAQRVHPRRAVRRRRASRSTQRTAARGDARCSTRRTSCSCSSTTASSPATGTGDSDDVAREGALAARHRRRPGRRLPAVRLQPRASSMGLTGWVLNSCDGVFTVVEGDAAAVDALPRARSRDARAADGGHRVASSPRRSSPRASRLRDPRVARRGEAR